MVDCRFGQHDGYSRPGMAERERRSLEIAETFMIVPQRLSRNILALTLDVGGCVLYRFHPSGRRLCEMK